MRYLFALSLLSLSLVSCSSRHGSLETHRFEAPSLAANRLGVPTGQQMAVYLPPSYSDASRRFPVLYLLPNFDTCLWRYTGGSYQRFHLREAMDELIARGEIPEMLVVIPNTVHPLGGSCFRNSPLSGNWEDYLARDVVGYVDTHFRTVATAAARGLAGHGMGGTGALELGLAHPDRFGSVYAMSPALFDPRGLQDAGLLSEVVRQSWQDRLRQWEGLDEKTRRLRFRDYIQTRLNSPSRPRFLEGLSVAYAAAVSVDLNLPYPHIAFPPPGPLPPASDPVVARFENGFGGWTEKVRRYRERDVRLGSITIEYTTGDEYPWIGRGSDYVSRVLREAGLAHDLLRREGGHDSTLGKRLRAGMLPAMGRALAGSP